MHLSQRTTRELILGGIFVIVSRLIPRVEASKPFFRPGKPRPINCSRRWRKEGEERRDSTIPDFFARARRRLGIRKKIQPFTSTCRASPAARQRTETGRETRRIRVTCQTNTWKIPFSTCIASYRRGVHGEHTRTTVTNDPLSLDGPRADPRNELRAGRNKVVGNRDAPRNSTSNAISIAGRVDVPFAFSRFLQVKALHLIMCFDLSSILTRGDLQLAFSSFEFEAPRQKCTH